jgi:hypothetical protein
VMYQNTWFNTAKTSRIRRRVFYDLQASSKQPFDTPAPGAAATPSYASRWPGTVDEIASRRSKAPETAFGTARSQGLEFREVVCFTRPITALERSRWRGGRFACYAPHVMPQRNASNCGSRARSFSKYFKTNSLQMSEKIEFP